MAKKNKLELWDLFQEKDWYMEQLEECRQDIGKLTFSTEEEDLSILHGYCNIMSAYILKIYALNERIKELANVDKKFN